jgi:hypothetical protein
MPNFETEKDPTPIDPVVRSVIHLWILGTFYSAQGCYYAKEESQ